jgi:hypothetical protein
MTAMEEPMASDTRLVQAINSTSKMYECRDAAKTLYGSKYAARMEEYGDAIKAVARSKQCSELQAVILMAKEVDGFARICLMAAYVELVEPS